MYINNLFEKIYYGGCALSHAFEKEKHVVEYAQQSESTFRSAYVFERCAANTG